MKIKRRRNPLRGFFIGMGVLAALGLTYVCVKGNLDRRVESILSSTPVGQMASVPQSLIDQGYEGEGVMVFPTTMPPSTPYPTLEGATPTPSGIDKIISLYGPIISGVPSIDIMEYKSRIEQKNLAASPLLLNLVDPEINTGFNILLEMNRNQDNRTDSDIFLMVSLKYNETTGGWDYLATNITRDLFIPEMGFTPQAGTLDNRINEYNSTSGYTQADFYDTISRITGLMPDLHIYVGDSHLFSDYIDKILGGLDVCMTDNLNDPNFNLFLEKGKCYTLNGESAVYTAVSRKTTSLGSRMTRQLDIFNSMLPQILAAYEGDPAKFLASLELLSQYEEEGKFFVRDTSQAYELPDTFYTDFPGDSNGYANAYRISPRFNMSPEQMMSVIISLGKGMIASDPENLGTINLSAVPDLLYPCLYPDWTGIINDPVNVPSRRCVFQEYFCARNLPATSSLDPFLPYYNPVRQAVRQVLLAGGK
jgi:hypothetical protein